MENIRNMRDRIKVVANIYGIVHKETLQIQPIIFITKSSWNRKQG
jgi:hypothetical protein